MNLNEIKTLIVGTVKTAFANKKTLDKFEEVNGTLRYNSVPVNNMPVFVADDSPVGSIISFMGNAAPQDYLICDGTEYNIAEYPLLAQHMLDEFGSYNYFGGDGETTFAVPDLRGEFLRGTGTATRNTGSGAKVGKHQDPTQIPFILLASSDLYMYYGDYSQLSETEQNNKWLLPTDVDKHIGSGQIYQTKNSGQWSSVQNANAKITARPTNTSVLYCIKYQITQNNISKDMDSYSLEEQVIGSWINGKPIYRKTIDTTITENGIFLAYSLESLAIDNLVNLRAIIQSSQTSNKSKYISGFHSKSSESHNAIFATWIGSNGNLYFYSNETIVLNQQVHVVIEYTKTTDAENSFTPKMLSSIQVNTTVTDEDVDDVIGGI